jgi:hypothetical protein
VNKCTISISSKYLGKGGNTNCAFTLRVTVSTSFCMTNAIIDVNLAELSTVAGANGKAGRVTKLGYAFNQNCVHSSA